MLTKGEKTRNRIVDLASRRARVAGLEGITLGPLAEELSLSKSGLFAHFHSKRELQFAVLDRAVEHFVAEVMDPSRKRGSGVPQLLAICERYLKWAQQEGGCPFIAFSVELDDRPGPLRERLVELTRQWHRRIRQIAREAIAQRQLRRGLDTDRFAFEFHCILVGAEIVLRLLRDRTAASHARAAVNELLERSREAPRR